MAMRGRRRPFVHICSDGLAPLQFKNFDDLIFYEENSVERPLEALYLPICCKCIKGPIFFL